MGVVYEAFDRELRSRIALKTLRELDARALYRFKREFRSLQGIEHPNLVSLGELVEHEGHWFFTMELVEGVDFLTYVRRGGDDDTTDRPLSDFSLSDSSLRKFQHEPDAIPRQALPPTFDEMRLRSTLAQLALGLAALHAAGKVHRDVKPSNILVTRAGRLVLLDFGLVAPMASTTELSTEDQVAGTVAYMAPELALTGQLGPEADWYSFGVLLYEALTTRLPHDGRTSLDILLKKQNEPPTPPRTLTAFVPADLEQLCLDLLEGDPQKRPPARDILVRLGIDPTSPRVPSTVRTAGGSPSPMFVGRSDELAVLGEAFIATVAGESRAVLVRGESGIGKSALLRHFAQQVTAERGDVVVLAGRCYERESVPYKAFDGVIDALTRHLRRLPLDEASSLVPRHAALLPRVFPILGGVEAIARAPRTPVDHKGTHELRRRVFAAVRELLTRLAERSPVIVVIDDLQWADADSRHLLEEVLRAPDAPPLLLLGSVRVSPGDEAESDAEPVFPCAHAVIDLAPLDVEAARELAARLLRRVDAGAGDPVAIAFEAHGHPLYIDELVRHAALVGGRSDHPERAHLTEIPDCTPPTVEMRPLRLDDAIRARVAQLDPAARYLLELIALADAPLARTVLAEAAAMDVPTTSKHLILLQVANLVRAGRRRGSDRIEPYHDRVREAVQASLSPGDRIAHHASLAAALENAPHVPPELVLRHLESAGAAEKAASYAVRAAERATAALAFDRAADLYRRALRRGGSSEIITQEQRELSIALGEALVCAGRGGEAADAFLAALPGADPTTRLDCQRRAAEQLLICGHIERGLEAIHDVLAEIGDALPDTPRRALVSLIWNQVKLRVHGLRWTEHDAGTISPATLTRLEVYRGLAFGLCVVDAIRGMDFIARGALLALHTGEPGRLALAIAYQASSFAGQGAMRSARRWVDAARGIAQRVGDPYLTAWVEMAEGAIAYFGGRPETSARHLASAEDTFRDYTSGSTFELNNARLFRLLSLRYQGLLAEMRDRRDEYVRDARSRGDRFAETSMRRCCNLLWLVADDPVQAQVDLESTGWMPPEGVFHVQHWYELEARAELAIYRDGTADAAARLAAEIDALRRSLLGRVPLVRVAANSVCARFALARSAEVADPAPFIKEARRLARRLDGEGLGYGPVFGRLVSAGAAAAVGDHDRAIAHYRIAAELADQHHMRIYATAARFRIGELLGGAEGDTLRDDARTWMTGEGVVQPERFLKVVAPLPVRPR